MYKRTKAGINSRITVPSKVCAPHVSTNITMTTDDDWGGKENKEISKKETCSYMKSIKYPVLLIWPEPVSFLILGSILKTKCLLLKINDDTYFSTKLIYCPH